MANAEESNKVRVTTDKERTEFLRHDLRPLMEDLATVYWATSPPPEDIVAFLIETLIHDKGLPEPETGALSENFKLETSDVLKRIQILQKEVDRLSD
mmetsp:Transcript_48867/g.79296  ORF Transcript_48867/g.79296 Transcript_48867/m.79296 type:complete len:97 (+) Transcript_48867:84-374(+)|eukprot:CAMPEP_0115115526 /NCGR_PEP_ID=MMETSP0227-20121206/42744_1 /TAXON_ID=89957 /ORGANISM="Polarella glacialis, Strain CCMP 1383" /LENGTH=96 /DNA_ID=CAMNT_0002516213 /DNA_START=84 /DNA_END=374 /DNA_ORIENTATION=+